MIKRIFSLFIIGIVSVVIFSGCLPKYASDEEITNFINNIVEEKYKFIEKSKNSDGDYDYKYKCINRDIYFTVSNKANHIIIDNANFGYSGNTSISTDYLNSCYEYYNDITNQLLKKYNFNIESTSANNSFYNDFIFIVDVNNKDLEVEQINKFLNDFRETVVEPELQYRSKKLEYTFKILYKIDENKYQDKVGNEHKNYIYANKIIDINKYIKSVDNYKSSVLPNVLNSIVLTVN